MSWRATTAVKKESRSEGTALLFSLMLADYADDYGICWPAIATLAEDCRVNERTIRRQIEELKEMGELLVYRRRRATSVYILNLPSLKPWDDEARRKVIEALTDYPDDLDRTICPRTEGAEELRPKYLGKNLDKDLIHSPVGKPLVSSSAPRVRVERDGLKSVAYFKGTTERVPNPSEIVHQEQSGEPMAWRPKDKFGNGRWVPVEWAS